MLEFSFYILCTFLIGDIFWFWIFILLFLELNGTISEWAIGRNKCWCNILETTLRCAPPSLWCSIFMWDWNVRFYVLQNEVRVWFSPWIRWSQEWVRFYNTVALFQLSLQKLASWLMRAHSFGRRLRICLENLSVRTATFIFDEQWIQSLGVLGAAEWWGVELLQDWEDREGKRSLLSC